MDDDESTEKPKHIRITINSDAINDTEERDEVKGFDSQTVVEIKFYKKDKDTTRVQIVPTKGDINHWKQYFAKEGLKDNWIQNGTLIQAMNPDIAVAE